MQQGKENQVTFEYRMSPGYAIYGVSGAHGGVNAFGEVVVSFFCERGPIPQKETRTIQPDGSLGPQVELVAEEAQMVREVMLGISMPPPVARSIARWLLAKADEFDKAMKPSGPPH